MNKLPFAIALAVVTQVSGLHAGVFSFLTGKGRSQGNQVSTGAGSKAEAKVDKNGSIVRVGSNTSAKVGDDGTVTLSKGVMLVSSGEGFLRRPPVQISTPQGDVTVRGSAIVAALPDGSVKMTVLEGNAKGMLGDRNMNLNPGQLMIQRHQSRDAVNVDLGALAASSTLLDSSQFQLPLPATPVIRQEVVDQAQSLGATLTLSGGNQGAGGQVVTNASDLKLVKNGQLPATTGAGTVGGGTLQLTSGSNSAVGATNAFLLSPTSTTTGGTLTLNSGTGLLVSGGDIVVRTGSLTFNGATIPPELAGSISGVGLSFLPKLTISGSSASLSSSAGVVVVTNTGATGTIGNGTLVLPPGSTQTGNLILSYAGNSLPLNTNTGTTTVSHVNTGAGTLVLNGTDRTGTTVTIPGGTQNVTLGAGSLVLQGAAAQQYLGGTVTIRDSNGLVLTPTNNGGVLRFQGSGTPTTTPATPAGGN